MECLPLSGVRVIDATAVVMGPYNYQWLADFSAEVIKVEAPQGDSTRQTGPSTEAGMAAIFMGFNRSKKSIVIDLKQADVFMHSMRPQKLAAVGRDREQLRATYPRLVYAGLHGFDTSGPYGGQPGVLG